MVIGLFGSFFRFIGSWLGLFQARVDEQNENLMQNPSLIRREGQLAKEELSQTYKQLWGVISGKVASRTQREERIAENGKRLGLIAAAKSLKITSEGKDPVSRIGVQLEQLSRARTSASRKLRARAQDLGVTSQEDPLALADPEFVEHRDNYARFSQQEKDLLGELSTMEADLRDSVKQDTDAVRKVGTELIQDRSRLRRMEREIKEIDGRVEDTVSAVLGRDEKRRQDEVLQSIDTSAAESRLAKLDRLQRKATAEGQVASEMSGGTVDSRYLDYASSSAVGDEIDALLGGGKAKENSATEGREPESLPNG